MAKKQNMPTFKREVIMSKVKVPKQLFVVHQKRVNSVPLGFLHEYNPHTTSGAKKMQTQLQWAFSGAYGIRVVEEDGRWYRRGRQWVHPAPIGGVRQQPYQEDVDEPLAVDLTPQVWDNDPLPGFKVDASTSRYTTHNKFWLIIDPRGFKFEVSTKNFEAIILNTTLERGEIMAPCIWVGNKNLILAD